MKYFLDEDVHPEVANIGRNLGLDVVSVHEVQRQELSDDAQLRFAASQSRVLVTRNRDDFIRLTVSWFEAGEPHFGVLIVPYSLPNNDPKRIAHALHRWNDQHGHQELNPYLIDFLGD